MKIISILACVLIWASCNGKMKPYYAALPNDSLINEVLLRAIEIDSLDTSFGVNPKLYFPSLYHPNELQDVPPSFCVKQLAKFFRHRGENEKERDDSIFANLQMNPKRTVNFPRDLAKLFKTDKKSYYVFFVPIFSFDGQYALVSYYKPIHGICGTGAEREILLKKQNRKWIKIDFYD